MTTHVAFPHGSPEHWRGRYEFRRDRGWDVEDVFAPGEYVVAPDEAGNPTVCLGLRAYERMRQTTQNPANRAFLDQCIAALKDENTHLAQEVPSGE